MTKEITIPREWLDKLVNLIDNAMREGDEVLKHAWLSYIIGYVHSLDIYLKEEGEK